MQHGVQLIVEQVADVRDGVHDVALIAAVDLAELDVRIVHAHFTAFADQGLQQQHHRAFAQVVGVLFEGEAKDADPLRRQVERKRDGAIELGVVGGQHGFEQRQFQVEARRAVDERAQIFGQAGAAEGEARLEVGGGDIQGVIAAEGVHDLGAIDAEFAGQRADLVGEGNLDGMEGVAGVLDHLRGAQRHDGGLHGQAGVDGRPPVARPRARSRRSPAVTGSMKSRTAAPSRRNSGLETTETSGEPPIWGSTTSSQVPG